MCVLLGLNVENNEQTGWAAGRQVLSWILFAETAKLKQERGTTGGSVTAWKRDTSKTPVHSHEERLVKNEERDESVYSYHPHQTSSWQTNTCRSVWEASRLIGKDTCHTHRLSSIRRGYSKSICEKLTLSSLSSSEDDHVGQEWKLFMNVKHKWSVWTQEDGEQPQVEAKPHDFLSAFTQIRAFKRDPGRCRIVQNQCFCLAI